MRTTIFGRRAHFRWNMGNICALNAGFCRAYIYIYKHVLHIHQVFSQLMQHRFWNAIRKVTHDYKTRHRRNPIHLKIYKHKASIINQSYKIQYKPLEKIYVTHQTYCSIVIKKQTEERYFPFVLLFSPSFAVSRPVYIIQTSKQMDKFSLFHSMVSVCSFSNTNYSLLICLL